MTGYCLLLVAAAFAQAPGRLVGDTKFDLVVGPARFLGRAWQLWDPVAAFGQVQNQAYGYFLPMGPFFLLGHLSGAPEWAVQRLWWSVLLVLAFVGTVKLARAMRLGTPATQVLTGFAFALSAHVLTLLGASSVEAWPTALAPWVLLPLVVGSERGSPRRAAALSAVAVALCGGVNAVAVLAVLPAPALWLLTRQRGHRRRALMLWWSTLTVMATLWWALPLLLLGRYSPPFLDYIENARLTTSTTSVPDVLSGTSDWVAYASPHDWVAGHLLGMTPLLLVDAAAVAGLGLAGICRRDNPHARFLLLTLVTGVLLVSFGYAGPGHGWFAEGRQSLLDGALAPFRNLHKFDVVVRIPLVLGFGHFVSCFQGRSLLPGRRALRAGVLLAAVSSVVGVAIPVYAGQVAPGAPVRAVPDYWYAAARYLAAHDSDGTALELPASGFGDYLWGSPHDDILQGLARSPWAVRNIIPLAQPGNVRLLDAVTGATELGRPDAQLAGFLASNGVGYLVVRNDLQVFRTEAPDPVVLHQALDRSPGLHRVAAFGPLIGVGAEATIARGRRVLTDRGRSARFRAVEIYQVGGGAPRVSGWRAGSVPVVSGDPASRLGTPAYATPGVLAGDRTPLVGGATLLTDGLQRREMAFTAVRRNESATMSPRAPWRLGSVEHAHRLYPTPHRWETTEAWEGVASVTASSSRAFADAVPPMDPSKAPAAAVDGRLRTEFVTSSRSGATGQWWRVRFASPIDPQDVTITLGHLDGGRVTDLALRTDTGTVSVPAPPPGGTGTFALPPGLTSLVEIRAERVSDDRAGAQLALAEVSLPGIDPMRALATPSGAFPAAPDQVVLTRSPQRRACSVVGPSTVCDDFQLTGSADGNVLDRIVTLPTPASYVVGIDARMRLSGDARRLIARRLPVQVTSTRPLSTDPAASALATVDRDMGTTWVADFSAGPPLLHVSWRGKVPLRSVDLVLSRRAGASAPRRITIVAPGERRRVTLDRLGHGSFPALTTDHMTIRFDTRDVAYSIEGQKVVPLPVGVSEMRLPGVTSPATWSPRSDLGLGCGSGPLMWIGGTPTRSRLEASLTSLLAGDPLSARLCGSSQAALPAGAVHLRLTPSSIAVPEQLTLSRVRVSAGDAAGAAGVPVRIVQWGAGHRQIQVPASTDATLLVVNENANDGWRARLAGRTLAVQRVDGWKQGWVVPAGTGGVVQLDFIPNRWYHLGLLLGALSLLLVVVLALRRGRGTAVPVGTASGAGGFDAVFLLLAGGLVAGWSGAVVIAAALAFRRSGFGQEVAGWAAASLAVLAGMVMGATRAEAFQAHSAPAQVLACLALAFTLLGANGPEFFRRRSGRSST